MNAATITALISAITALIGAATGLIILIVHIVRHQPIPGGKPPNSPPKIGMINPGITDQRK